MPVRGVAPALEFEADEPEQPAAPEPGALANSRRELARLWSELLAAAPTDARARQFIAYFRPDAERLFAGESAPGK